MKRMCLTWIYRSNVSHQRIVYMDWDLQRCLLPSDLSSYGATIFVLDSDALYSLSYTVCRQFHFVSNADLQVALFLRSGHVACVVVKGKTGIDS